MNIFIMIFSAAKQQQFDENVEKAREGLATQLSDAMNKAGGGMEAMEFDVTPGQPGLRIMLTHSFHLRQTGIKSYLIRIATLPDKIKPFSFIKHNTELFLGSGVEGTETVTPASFHAELTTGNSETDGKNWANVGDPRKNLIN